MIRPGGSGVKGRGREYLRSHLFRLSWVYLVLALINLRIKLALTAAWFDGRLETNHARLLAFQYVNHEQSRLLQFYLPEFWLQIFDLSVPQAYILQRWLFVFLAFVCFHLYLRGWLDEKLSFLGVVLLAAIMPLTYFNHLQESAPLLLLTFLLGLWAIREHRDFAYAAILLIGAVNNETLLILPAVYLAYNFKGSESTQGARLWVSTVLTSLPAFAVWGAIRFQNRDRPYLGGGELGNAFATNLEGVLSGLTASPLEYWRMPYLYIFFVFGALWIYAFRRFREKPLFLQRAALIVPPFVAVHFAVGVIYEVRQMLPIAFILLPMALLTLFPEETHQEG